MADNPAIGLRERKKQITRQALLDTATRLFEERGYDNVTVAEIADAVNISVKTMFTYFASKEDLAFGEESLLRDALVAGIEQRPAGSTVLDAVAAALREAVSASDSEQILAGTRGYHRGYGDSPALQNRLRRMWSEYEDALTDAVRTSSPKIRSTDARLEAMRATLLVRSTTTTEVRDLIQAANNPRAAMLAWIRSAAKSLAPTTGHTSARRKPA